MIKTRRDFLVYMAGPITGLSYDGATSWRDDVRQQLADISDGRIIASSPMRNKNYLSGESSIGDSYEDSVLSSQRGIFYRDKFDCTRSDLVLVNLLGTTRVSIGTVMEIAWANLNQIPIVLVMEKAGNLHDHAMVREACPFWVDNLDEAVEITAKVLLP